MLVSPRELRVRTEFDAPLTRQKYITNQMLDQHGRTPLCIRCSLGTGSYSSDCRTRFEAIWTRELAEAEVHRARINPKNLTSREKQEHEDSGHAVYRNWCAACDQGRGVGGHIEWNCWRKRKEKEQLRFVAFDYGFLTQENADTFPILIC